MKNIYVIFATILLFAFPVQANEFEAAQAQLRTFFNEELADAAVKNASWAIYSPSKNIDWTFAGGQFSSGEKISDANPFYTASIGKTFTATAVAMLYEQGRLNLSDKVVQHLPMHLTKDLHLYDGRDYTQKITIKHLLQHTSGLPDYFQDETIDGSLNGMAFLFENTNRYWAPEELISISKRHMKPHFKPGTDYRYSDTGYVLLGLIVENISGQRLHEFFKQHIFAPLNMKNTYMLLRQQPSLATSKMAELYVDSTEISIYKSLSLDWAGGGLASTARDLNKFQSALHSHQLLRPETLTKMQEWVPESKGFYYGLGLRKVVTGERFSSKTNFILIGHTGSTSSFMFFCPELDIYLSGTLNQINQAKKSITIPFEILRYLKKDEENED